SELAGGAPRWVVATLDATRALAMLGPRTTALAAPGSVTLSAAEFEATAATESTTVRGSTGVGATASDATRTSGGDDGDCAPSGDIPDMMAANARTEMERTCTGL